MATTETRSGFRLPWPGGGDAHHDDQLTPDAPVTQPPQDPVAQEPAPADAVASQDEPIATVPDAAAASDQAAEPVGPVLTEPAPAVAPVATASIPTPAAPPEADQSTAEGSRPNEFLAGLTRAMRTAAESEREQILARFEDEAHTYKSGIRERSDEEADALRQRADDDVDGIHAWSERELARIQEETERRIERRRARLDEELDGNRAEADRQVERVEAAVGTFGEQMTRFFERLLAEEDPARFAALAANLPVPPALDAEATREVTPASEPAADPQPAAPPVSDPVWSGASSVADTATDPQPAASDTDPWRDVRMSGTSSEATPEATDETDDPPTEASQPTTDGTTASPSHDPRIAALGLTPDFAAAEAEAAAAAEDEPDGADTDAPAMDDASVAARLAGLTDTSEPTPGANTRLIVVGLVSVASIAGFKRQVGRLPGVSKVGVSSGPDGEFVFTVAHAEGVDLREPVTTLPGFGARVVGVEDDAIRVECRDPESNG